MALRPRRARERRWIHEDGQGRIYVRQRPGQRRIYLRLSPDARRLEITAPLGLSSQALLDLVQEELVRLRQRQASLLATRPQAGQRYAPGSRHWLWGQTYPLERRSLEQGKPRLEWTGTHFCLSSRGAVQDADGYKLFTEFYKCQLLLELEQILPHYCAQLGLPRPQISLRPMRSRWGSCSPGRASIRLNTDLAKLPRSALNYVLVHELLHFYHPDHSPAFYTALSRNYPAWPRLHEQLRQWPKEVPLLGQDWPDRTD